MVLLNIRFSIGNTDFAFQPVRVGVPTVILALVAVGMSRGRSRLPAFALAFAAFCWFAGMIVAIGLDKPLY